MKVQIHTPTEMVSRYGLLGAMGEELASAFEACGHARGGEGGGGADLSIYSFFNFPEQARSIMTWANPSRPRTALLHLFVDHPLAMDERQIDEFSRAPGYRLVLPCADETSLMPMRWPSLKFARVPHAVPASALCAESEIGGLREVDVVVAGTIPTEGEIAQRRAMVPATAVKACDLMAEVMLADARMGFTQAWDVTAPGSLGGADQWRLMRLMWRYVVDRVNRERRLAMVRELRGLKTAVYGPEVWREHCTGTVEYRGEVGYADVGRVMRSGRVCLAWNPTQFVHSWSERALLAMASGCATVTDDRALVRRELGAGVETFETSAPTSMRAAIERLLGDEGRREELARRGWAMVRGAHLWEHRVPTLVAIAAGVVGMVAAAGAKAA